MGYASASAFLLHDPAWKGYALAAAGHWEDAAAAFGDAPANAYNKGNVLALSHHYHDAIEAYENALDANPEDEDARFNKELVRRILAGGAVDASPSRNSANATANKEHHGKSSDYHDGEASSSGNGFTGNQEGASTSGAQGNSKVSKVGAGSKGSADNGLGKATGSASAGSGVGRAGGNLADVTAMLRENQRRFVRGYTGEAVVPTIEWLQTLRDDPGEYLKLRIKAEQIRRAAHAASSKEDDD
jgi:Ca-activated chloride channel family protein